MIRRLRRNFILIASSAILLILSVILLVVNTISYISNYYESMSILDIISDNCGRIPSDEQFDGFSFQVSRELPYETRYFTLVYNSDEELMLADYEHISTVDNISKSYISKIISGKSTKGMYKTRNHHTGGYYFYKKSQIKGEDVISFISQNNFTYADTPQINEDGTYTLIVFMDATNRMYRLHRIHLLSLMAGIGFYLVFVLLVSALSNRAIQPFIETYEKQRQFITNAGHELKTPLAIISANTEVMEAMNGKSEWTQSNMNQVKRLSGLISDLITLARMEEASEMNESVNEEIDLSTQLGEIASSFRPVIEQRGKKLEIDIDDGIRIKGSPKSMHELISILLDNAAKYCDDSGTVRVELRQQRKQASIVISNSYKEGDNVDHSRFFERFYREDSSHNSEKSGYGIGLSMAESIVNLHKGKITADHSNGITYFRVLI